MRNTSGLRCNHVLTFVTVLLLASGCSSDNGAPATQLPAPTADANRQALAGEAQTLAQRFVGTLQPALQSAMQDGGPAAAIEVCADVAPEIARTLSAESGWQVRRVSLKPRNTATAMPDNWETDVLKQFDARQQAGEAGNTINRAEIVDNKFRYMQAQPAGPLCLTCHGKDLDTQVKAALSELYPADRATGYQAGEIRGAISLSKRLNPTP